MASSSAPVVPDIQTIRNTIPKHCFQPSNVRSLAYVFRDLTLIATLFYLGLYIPSVETLALRWALWMAYGAVQGMICTGLWIIAHECGHQALFTPRWLNDVIGLPLHSMLLVPYFSWKFSHARHHRYTNHMEKDTAFVPCQKGEPSLIENMQNWLHLPEDTPILNLLTLLFHQTLGWPLYLLFNLSAGENSLHTSTRKDSKKQSHFHVNGDLFSVTEHPFILISDMGLVAMSVVIYYAGCKLGWQNMALLYFVPYMWVNHWIVAITYLHHTHPTVAHYGPEEWTYSKGALGTVDRDLGFVGRHLFHGIIEYHVIHHLFPRIPFYHAEEATKSTLQLLGGNYRQETTSFWGALWETFSKCKYVMPASDNAHVFEWAVETSSCT